MSLYLDFHKLEAVGHEGQHTSEKGAVIQDEKLGFIGNVKNRISTSINSTRDPRLATLDVQKSQKFYFNLNPSLFSAQFSQNSSNPQFHNVQRFQILYIICYQIS